MTKLLFSFLFSLLLINAEATAQQLTISDLQIASSIENQQPIGVDTSFAADIGSVFCYTRVEGIVEDAKIYQVWYHKDEEQARIELNLDEDDNGHIWSSTSIMDAPGKWRVMVEDTNGLVLATTSFQIQKNP